MKMYRYISYKQRKTTIIKTISANITKLPIPHLIYASSKKSLPHCHGHTRFPTPEDLRSYSQTSDRNSPHRRDHPAVSFLDRRCRIVGIAAG